METSKNVEIDNSATGTKRALRPQDDANNSNTKKDEECEENKTRKCTPLPADAVAILKQWLLSPEHFSHPYPNKEEKELLLQKTRIQKKQLDGWFSYARQRIWKPMVKQLDDGVLVPTIGLRRPLLFNSFAAYAQLNNSLQAPGHEQQEKVSQIKIS